MQSPGEWNSSFPAGKACESSCVVQSPTVARAMFPMHCPSASRAGGWAGSHWDHILVAPASILGFGNGHRPSKDCSSCAGGSRRLLQGADKEFASVNTDVCGKGWAVRWVPPSCVGFQACVWHGEFAQSLTQSQPALGFFVCGSSALAWLFLPRVCVHSLHLSVAVKELITLRRDRPLLKSFTTPAFNGSVFPAGAAAQLVKALAAAARVSGSQSATLSPGPRHWADLPGAARTGERARGKRGALEALFTGSRFGDSH